MAGFAGIVRGGIAPMTGAVRAVFLCILVECNHADNPNFLFDNKPCPLRRGDWVASVKRIEELTGLTTKQVRNAIQKLAKLGILRANSMANRATLLSVENIDVFLINPDAGASSGANQGQTKGKPRAINNKDNNNNNDHNKNINTAPKPKSRVKPVDKYIATPPDGVRADVWSGYLEMRENKNNSLSVKRQKDLLVQELNQIINEHGQCPNKIIDRSIVKGWATFHPIPENKTNEVINHVEKSNQSKGIGNLLAAAQGQ